MPNLFKDIDVLMFSESGMFSKSSLLLNFIDRYRTTSSPPSSFTSSGFLTKETSAFFFFISSISFTADSIWYFSSVCVASILPINSREVASEDWQNIVIRKIFFKAGPILKVSYCHCKLLSYFWWGELPINS